MFAEMEQIAQHLPLHAGQIAVFGLFAIGRMLVLMLVDRFFQLGAKGTVAIIGT
jgi:hypothetical protein